MALALTAFLVLSGLALDAVATARVARAYTGTPGQYVPVTPVRILDTRNGTGGRLGAAGPAGSIGLAIAGQNNVPAGAIAVTLNVTVTDTTAQSFLTVWPDGDPRPQASNLNWGPGATVANLVQVGLGGGAVDLYNAQGYASVIVDLEGYYLPAPTAGLNGAGQFRPLMPARIMDTRSGLGHSGQIGANQIVPLVVLGTGNVPATGVSAVVLNLTVTNGGATSYLTVFPTGAPTRPQASNLNYAPYQTVANRVTVPVGSGGQVSIYNSQGGADVIVDVNGYFTDSTAGAVTGGLFTAVSPVRLLDTRDGTGTTGPGATAANSILSLQVTGRGGVPAGAGSAVLNVTSVDAGAPSYLTLFASGDVPVVASDVNFGGGVVPNLVPVRLGADGKVNIYNAAAATHVLADVVGFYSSAPDNGTVSASPTIGGVVPGDHSATVSWTPPASNTTITGYYVTSLPAGSAAAVFGTETSVTLTGLTNTVSYTFLVYATNGVGASAPGGSTPVTPVGSPEAPTGVTAVPYPDSAYVCWQAPANNGGSPITGFLLTGWPGAFHASAAATASCFYFQGWLTGGVTYFFTVQAINSFGAGPGTNSNLVTPTSSQAHKIVVSLSQQHMWVYQGAVVLRESDVTTGRPELPTPPGDYHVFYKTSPYQMISPWPPGSPFWYPNAWVQWVLEFKEGGYFLHDAPWRSWFGPGSQYGDGTHGCINIPTDVMQWLYSWANVGDEVVVQN